MLGARGEWPVAGLLAAILCVAFAENAGADDHDVLRNFGLAGHWAIDCSKPPSSANPHTRYVISDGWPPIYEVTFGDQRTAAAWTVRNAHSDAEDRLGLELAIGAVTFAKIVVRKSGGRIKSMESTDGEGRPLIRDGVLVRTGKETPWLERCSGNPIS